MFNKRCCDRQNMGCCMPMDCGCQSQPIIEPCINKCVEREFCHQVPHVCPIHTHVINRHIYQHTYTPQYSTSEENQVINIDNGSCQGLANNRPFGQF